MTAPLHERPSIPLTAGERDRFADLIAPLVHQPRTVRYYTPRARLRRLARRMARSPFAGHLRAATRAAFWPLAIGSGLLLAAVVLTYLQTLTPVTGGIR